MSHEQSAFVLNISTAVIRPTCIYLKLLLDMQNMQQCKRILNMLRRSLYSSASRYLLYCSADLHVQISNVISILPALLSTESTGDTPIVIDCIEDASLSLL